MNRTCLRLSLFALACGLLVVSFSADGPAGLSGHALAQKKDDADKPGAQAYAFLKKYCADCHQGAKPTSGVADFDVTSYDNLTKKRVMDGKPWFYAQPGSKGKDGLTASYLWQQLGVDKTMPPEKFMDKKVEKLPTDKELEIVKKWIETGAAKEGFGPAGKGK